MRETPESRPSPPPLDADDDVLERARAAARQHDWATAVAAFGEADAASPLGPEDLELLGAAAWWAALPGESDDALERAVAAYVDRGDPAAAANAALSLAYQLLRAGNMPVGGGWIARATRLLADQPEGPAHARLAVFEAIGVLFAGRFDLAVPILDRAIDIATRHGAPSELYIATSFRGMAKAFNGDWQAGMAEIDEAAAAASSGELDIRVASDIYCNTIAACRTIGDLDRAAQWADAGERWMRRNGAGGYPGVCRVHRAELKMLRGNWEEAEAEAKQACDELQRFNLVDSLGYAHDAIGEVRLRMGDLDGAQAAFDKAYEYGHDAQPGFALLQLARGEVAEARRSLGRALERSAGEGVTNRGARARLLPAQVEVTLAAGDLDEARSAVEELETIAADFERPLFQAGAKTARGELLLGERRASEASPLLGESWRLWQTTNLPYEAARARLHYAEALAAEGDTATARRDMAAARSGFERLGATLDLRRVESLAAELDAASAASATPGPATEPGERATRTFMFTDIVTSTDLLGLIGDDAWSELLRWHDRELRAAIADHGGQEVSHTGDGFFVAFETARAGIDGAIDIQRRLARHRREHGFAPWVRIGLHTAEATREGANFSGRGVHVAARVGAAAEREQILVTQAVLDEARATDGGDGGVPGLAAAAKPLQLKGVKEPVEVASVAWRE